MVENRSLIDQDYVHIEQLSLNSPKTGSPRTGSPRRNMSPSSTPRRGNSRPGSPRRQSPLGSPRGSPRSASPLLDSSQKGVTFDSVHPQDFEFDGGEMIPGDMNRYLSTRRQTIAVPQYDPDFLQQHVFSRRQVMTADSHENIPSISISCRSPTPPCITDSRELSYKEQYLPRPAVLQVRPQFDRRASDGSATLQASIAQFNSLRTAQAMYLQHRTNENGSSGGDSGKSSYEHMLHSPATEDAGSESDKEPDLEAVSRYMKNRGGRQRHTVHLPSPSLEPTIEEGGDPGHGLKAFHVQLQGGKRTSVGSSRERASPIPYVLGSSVSPEARSRFSGGRRSSDSAASVMVYNKGGSDKKGQSSESMLKHLREEHQKLTQQYSTEQPVNRLAQRRAAHRVRDTTFRHSYPFSFPDTSTTDSHGKDVPSDLPAAEERLTPSLIYLRQKQEAERENLRVQMMVEEKILKKQQEQETEDFIRRHSDGIVSLQDSISEFLSTHQPTPSPKSGPNSPKEPRTFTLPGPPLSESLPEDMQNLNLTAFSSISGVSLPQAQHPGMPQFLEQSHPAFSTTHRSTLPSRHINAVPTPVMSTYSSMEVDETHRAPVIPHFPFANINMPSLFRSPNMGPGRSPLAHTPIRDSPYRQATGLGHPPTSRSAYLPNGRPFWPGMLDSSPEEVQPVAPSTPVAIDTNEEKLELNPLRSALSVNMTSDRLVEDIVAEIKRCLDERSSILDYNQSDTFFSLYKDGVQMEIEVFPIPDNKTLNGVKLRRVGGDNWAYKRLRDEILKGIHL